MGAGLEGVVVADTVLSDVDGEAGRLVIRGHPIESLAGRVSFEQAVALLFTGELPADPTPWQRGLAQGRATAFERLPALGDALDAADGMDALRAATAHLRTDDPLAATGALATFAAAWARRRAGQPPLAPDPTAPHACDYLRMINGAARQGARPLDESSRVAALDAYLVTVIDHGMNASTFAARVVASTGSDLVSSIVAAIGALKGPLHGGAPGPVLDMLDAIGAPERAHTWLDAELGAGRRIMGMGHRIYRVRDPRAAVLERAATALERAGAGGSRLTIARAIEREAEAILAARHPDRALRANVEFYTAVLLEAIGVPRTLFSPTFAVARAAGWCAHVDEQRRTGRLIRPASRYVGP